MSATIDEKVVEMRFDNKQFESGVSTTMSTLDKLKNSLKLDGAAKGLENVSSAAKNLNLSGIGNAVETVQAKFSALEVMGITALANITNSAVNAGKRIVSALTIDPIKTGFQEYETQINSVQTILANTQSKGTTLNDVNNALDTLNTYADKTIYNFTEMTRNIGTFTAAGVDLDTSVNAIQGIANLAAVSGSTSQQASTAMYQLSQALATGTVKLQDWNSVVNAGMGGQVFQDALVRTAAVMSGSANDVEAWRKKNIDSYGSFRDSLTEGAWLTTDVLTATLSQFTGNMSDAELKAQGYTDQQIKDIQSMAKTANDAATKVKTFTQLWDTLKEAAQSGWTQSWEIIVGDFEEAKGLLTNISDTVGAMIGKSAEARNEILQGWKDLGGRKDIIDALKNSFEGISSVVKPIKEAFREIFPPVTAKQLADFSRGLKELTSHFILSKENSDKLKQTFKGLFSIVDIGVMAFKSLGKGALTIIKSLTGFGGNILDISSSFGSLSIQLRDYIKENDIFGKSVEKVTGFITNIISKLKELKSSMSDAPDDSKFSGILGFFKSLWGIVSTIGSKVVDFITGITKSISELAGKGNILEVINSGLLTGILVGINKFTSNISGSTKGFNGILKNVKGILDEVRECFKAYQNQIKAETLKQIAIAIAILAASIFVISTIDEGSLTKSLVSIGILFAVLLKSLSKFIDISNNMKGATKSIAAMIGMSTAIILLAAAMKILSSISFEGLVKGLVSVGILMGELLVFLKVVSTFDKKAKFASVSIVILAASMIILAKAVKAFGSMDVGTISKGLISIGILLGELAVFSKLTGNAKHIVSTGVSMVLLGASMKILASAVKDFSNMKLESIKRGLSAMAGALAELTIAVNLMPRNIKSIGVGLLIVSGAMNVLSNTMKKFGGMNWDEIKRGLSAMGGSLAEIAIALRLMNGTTSGSLALIIAAGALAIIVPVMKTLGSMSWESIVKGLVSLAGAFTVIGVAGLLLSPLIPTLLGLAGAFTLIGVSVLAIGAGVSLLGIGLTAIATGITALVSALSVGTTVIVSSLTAIIVGLADLIPTLVTKFGEAIIAFAKVIGDCAPQLAESFLKLITSVLKSLSVYTPQMVNYLLDFLIGIINGIADHMPKLISAAVNLIGSFLKGIIDALNGIDTTNILKGVSAIGLLTILMYALSGLISALPGAMAGVVGLGILIAELAIVLAAIGGLAQIPGLEWLISEGGNFLQTIGTAIGQFVGGIVGGFGLGATSSLPDIGTNLSTFMTNVSGFISGVKTIDESTLTGVKSLVSMIAILTGGSILEKISSFVTGGSYMDTFSTQIGTFADAIISFSNKVKGNIDEESLTAAANAGKLLAEMQSSISLSGPITDYFSSNNLDTFGNQLLSFADAIVGFSKKVSGKIDAEAVSAASNAGKVMAAVQKAIPKNTIGDGKKSLSGFGKDIKKFGGYIAEYSKNVSGINTSAVNSSTYAAKNIVSIVKSMSGIKSSNAKEFKDSVNALSKSNVNDFVKAFSVKTSSLSKSGVNAISSLIKGMKSKQSSLNSTVSSIISSMVKTINSKNSSFVKCGEALINSFIKGINSQKSKIKSSMTSSLSVLASSVKNKYGAMNSAGKYLGEGLINGIKSKETAVYNAGYRLGQKAVKGEKDGQKSKSPSKLTIQAGKWLGEGLIIGIDKMGANVYKSGKSLGKTAVDSISLAMTRAVNLIDSGVGTNPTISPVIDLSNVKSGINAVNSLFEDGPSMSLMSNVDTINSLMNGNIQNGYNDDIVSAIDKLRDDLGNVGNTYYTIDGITYDDGSNISGAVETLIRAAKIERRR